MIVRLSFYNIMVLLFLAASNDAWLLEASTIFILLHSSQLLGTIVLHLNHLLQLANFGCLLAIVVVTLLKGIILCCRLRCCYLLLFSRWGKTIVIHVDA